MSDFPLNSAPMFPRSLSTDDRPDASDAIKRDDENPFSFKSF